MNTWSKETEVLYSTDYHVRIFPLSDADKFPPEHNFLTNRSGSGVLFLLE
jgi:hypothetical protein